MRCRRAFTLTELLVVMGIMAVLAVLSAMAVKSVSEDVKLAGATNQIMTFLGNARAEAIRKNRCVLVVFRARPLADSRQVTYATAAEWTGRFRVIAGAAGGGLDVVNEPYLPSPTLESIELPAGIKVAAPRSDFAQAGRYITQPEFSNTLSGVMERGRMFGILFAADGTLATRNPAAPTANAGYASAYVDWDRPFGDTNFEQDVGTTSDGARFFVYDEVDDEPSIQYAQSLVVFSDADCREQYDGSQWRGIGAPEDRMRADQSEFITQNGNRIEFNRYTGVAQLVER